MKSPGSFPPAFDLLVFGHILSNALKKIIPDRAALSLFAKLRLNPVIDFARDAIKLGQRWEIVRRLDPEENFVFGYWILIR